MASQPLENNHTLPETPEIMPETAAENEPARPGRWRRLRAWMARTWLRLQPGPPARRGAAWGAAGAAALAAGIAGFWFRAGFGPVWDVPAGVMIAWLLVALAALALILAIKLLNLFPRFLGWTGFAAVGAFASAVLLGFGLPPVLGIAFGFGLGCLEAALGGSLALLLGKQKLRPAKRIVLAVLAVAALAVNAWVLVWLGGHGSREHLVKVKAGTSSGVVPQIAAADPGLPGSWRVLSLTYGSGTDRWRPEFGRRAALRTRPVDATPFLTGNEDWTVGVRKWFWGFDFDAFPLNGRVWYPDGGGPFPLVLMVHGNHDMAQFSDPGYAYLGELFASRGFIAVSVDENFFNGFWSGGIDKENDGRGWLLLKHLETWRSWNGTPGNPFHGKVDLERIALIGHSRGGEAAAIAALFNRLPFYPDDADVPLGFNFGIRAVVAIAPSDGQYKPAGKPTPLKGVSYLTLQGAHDGDVSSFSGEKQYQRVTLDPGGPFAFKAAVYDYRSNHGQFNTVWGDADADWPRSFLLNRAALLDGEVQRRLAKVTITAFLEATLHDEKAYVQLFRDARSARAWLPEDLYITRFQDNAFQPVATYEEDVDLTTATLPGATFAGSHLALWNEQDLTFRRGSNTQQNQAVFLGWRQGPAASYAVRLPQPLPKDFAVGPGSSLVLSLADADREPPDAKKKKSGTPGAAEKKAAEEKAKKKKEREKREKRDGKEPLDLSIELVAAGGTAVRLPLSRFHPVPVPFESHFTKLDDESDLYGKSWEPVLQTFEIPLAAFATADPRFTPATLTEIRLVFDRSPEGVVILDDVGIAPAAAVTSPPPPTANGSPH
jgi:dienelactone hydrolase